MLALIQIGVLSKYLYPGPHSYNWLCFLVLEILFVRTHLVIYQFHLLKKKGKYSSWPIAFLPSYATVCSSLDLKLVAVVVCSTLVRHGGTELRSNLKITTLATSARGSEKVPAYPGTFQPNHG